MAIKFKIFFIILLVLFFRLAGTEETPVYYSSDNLKVSFTESGEIKEVILKEKSPYEEDDFKSVPMKKVKCQKLLALHKQAAQRYKKLGKFMKMVEKKYSHKSSQYERAEQHYENAIQDADELGIAYEKQCKKEAPYHG